MVPAEVRPVRLLAMAILLAAIGIMASACDYWADFTIVNASQHGVLTWVTYRSCDAPGFGRRDDYSSPATVAPNSTYHYSGRTAADPKCIQVTTTERRLVVSRAAQMGVTITIHDPVQPVGDPIPQRGSLPQQTWGQRLGSFSIGEWILGAGVASFWGYVLFMLARRLHEVLTAGRRRQPRP
jgi:hypothetical protein